MWSAKRPETECAADCRCVNAKTKTFTTGLPVLRGKRFNLKTLAARRASGKLSVVTCLACGRLCSEDECLQRHKCKVMPRTNVLPRS